MPAESISPEQFRKIKSRPKPLNDMMWALKVSKIEYQEEYRFHPTRKWRFDFAIPSMMVAIEYEGIHSAKSRHTTVTGYSKDTEKYNAATILGWKVLRYTAQTSGNIINDLKQIQNGNK